MNEQLMIKALPGLDVPFVFATRCDMAAWNVPEALSALLREGPSNPHFMSVWRETLEIAHRVDERGNLWELEQDKDGSLWAVCPEVEP